MIAGPEPVRYADFVRAVATAAGLRKPLDSALPRGAADPGGSSDPACARHCRPVQPEEIRRLVEDKAFDIGPMRALLCGRSDTA